MPVERVNPDGLVNMPIYSQVVKVNNSTLVFAAGQVAWDEHGQIVGQGDFRKQVEQSARNIDTILKSMGANWANVVKLTIYIPQYDATTHRLALFEVLRQFIDSDNLPSMTLLGVQALARPELMIEIEAVIALQD